MSRQCSHALLKGILWRSRKSNFHGRIAALFPQSAASPTISLEERSSAGFPRTCGLTGKIGLGHATSVARVKAKPSSDWSWLPSVEQVPA
jgi:hypothetical protein